VRSQAIDHVGVKRGIGVDPKRFLAAGGECVAGHLAAGQVDLLISVHAPDAIAAALQLAQRCLTRRLDPFRDRNEDGALAWRAG
jgi:hypothetical protein